MDRFENPKKSLLVNFFVFSARFRPDPKVEFLYSRLYVYRTLFGGPKTVQYRVCSIYKESNIWVISNLGGQKSVQYRVCSIFDVFNIREATVLTLIVNRKKEKKGLYFVLFFII